MNDIGKEIILHGCNPDTEYGLCNSDCPNLIKYNHPFYHNTAWCWYLMKDLSWYDYWQADCENSIPNKLMLKVKNCGRTTPPNISKDINV